MDAQPPVILTVTLLGPGIVTSSPAGISCGSTCSYAFPAGTSVTLTAAPSGGSAFRAWSGACTGLAAACTLTVTTEELVTATFDVTVPSVPASARGCHVPNVTGRVLSAARKAIRHAGCTVGRIGRAFSKRVERGHVISQRPRKGATVGLATRVGLVVSRGKPPLQ